MNEKNYATSCTTSTNISIANFIKNLWITPPDRQFTKPPSVREQFSLIIESKIISCTWRMYNMIMFATPTVNKQKQENCSLTDGENVNIVWYA
jgi:hypothetical protein